MNGLKLCINNGEEIYASISDGSLHIIVGQKIESDGELKTTLNFTGLDTKRNEYIDWYKSELFTGDKIIIEVKDIIENSEPKLIREVNNRKISNKNKLIQFKKLKKELEDEGLL